MPEVLEIQIQDKASAGGSGPPRAPAAGGAPVSAGAAPNQPGPAPGASPGKPAPKSAGKPWFLEEFSDTIGRIHQSFDKVKNKATEAFHTIGSHFKKTASEAPHSPNTSAAKGAPKAPSATTSAAKGAPKPPSAASATTGAAKGAGAAEGAAGGAAEGVAGGAAEGAGAMEGVGGLLEGLGALDAATGGLATPFVVLAAVVGVGAVVAVEAFKLGVHLATDEITLFGLKLSASADDLAAYSPQLSMANSNAEIRSIMEDIKESQEVSPDLARIVAAQSEAQHQMREIWLPIKKVITEIIASVMEQLAEWLKDARVLVSAEFWEELGKQLTAAMKAEIAGGITLEEAATRIAKKVDDIKKKMDSEETVGADMWLRDLYGAHFDEASARDRLRGLSGDPRPSIPIVSP